MSLAYPAAAGSALAACAISDNSGQNLVQPRVYYQTTPASPPLTGSDVCEVAYEGGGDWDNTDLTKASSGLLTTPPALAGTAITCCAVNDNAEEGFEQPRVYFIGPATVTGKQSMVSELAYNNNGWSYRDLKHETAAGSAIACCVVLSSTAQSFDQPRVYYLDSKNDVNELAYNSSGGWTHSNLMREAKCSAAQPGSALACCSLSSGGNLEPRVYYLNAGLIVNELSYQNGEWQNRTLSMGAPVKGSPLTCCVVESGDEEGNEEPRVYYLNSTGQVNELAYNAGDWSNNSLPGTATSGSTSLTCCALLSGGDVQPRVYYLASNNVNELAYNGGGDWSNQSLSGGSATAGSAVTCCIVESGDEDGDQQPRVYFLGSGDALTELAYTGGKWQSSQIGS